MPVTALVLLLFCFIVISAFFTIAETAFTSFNRNSFKQLAQDGNKKARRLLDLTEKPEPILSSMQMFIRFAGFLTSAAIAVVLSDCLSDWLAMREIPYAQPVTIVIIALVLSFIALVFGEFYPKKVALLYPDQIALSVAGSVRTVTGILKPFFFLVTKGVDLLMVITRQHNKVAPDAFSEDDVMSMLEVGKEAGALKEEGQKMITSIFAFDDKLAYEVMTPRTDVFTIDIDDPAEEYIDELMELRHSRIPVYEDDNDNIIGILNIKDYLIKAREDGFDHVELPRFCANRISCRKRRTSTPCWAICRNPSSI